MSVLDAGCGSGAQCEWLTDHGAEVVGIDLSPAMVEQARLRCGDRARFLVADLAQPLALFLDHPFGPPLPGQHGGYFDQELVSDTCIKADVQVTQHFWHRPLAAVIDAFAGAGFVLERVAEPQPSRDDIRKFPADLEGVVGTPSFIVYRLRLSAWSG